MLNLAVANQQMNDLIAQQVLPPIVEGLIRLKLSMEENISFVPTERVRHFGRRQRHQGRQPQTSTQRGQHRNDEAGPSISTQPNMYSSTQARPSTSVDNEPTTFNEYNPINVNKYCMNLYQHIGEIPTSIGQGFKGLFSYDHYSQPSSTLPSYHPSPPPSYAGQYNYDQEIGRAHV